MESFFFCSASPAFIINLILIQLLYILFFLSAPICKPDASAQLRILLGDPFSSHFLILLFPYLQFSYTSLVGFSFMAYRHINRLGNRWELLTHATKPRSRRSHFDLAWTHQLSTMWSGDEHRNNNKWVWQPMSLIVPTFSRWNSSGDRYANSINISLWDSFLR
jgi:hypothetical protein